MSNVENVKKYLDEKVNGCQSEVSTPENGDSSLFVDVSKIKEVCLALKDWSDCPYRVLQTITGTDYEDRIEVSYVLATFLKENNQELILKVKVPRVNPEIESVINVWKSADFLERECYDMLGVKFLNHPDLRRILCPDDWEGFPLRKDYVVAEVYNGMVVNPEEKMNNPERGFASIQKQDPAAKRPELDW